MCINNYTGLRERHIESFPRIPSHYCRQSTNKEYLEMKIFLQKMYELYEEKCKRDGIRVENICIYRKVFNESFNTEFQLFKSQKRTNVTHLDNLKYNLSIVR